MNSNDIEKLLKEIYPNHEDFDPTNRFEESSGGINLIIDVQKKVRRSDFDIEKIIRELYE